MSERLGHIRTNSSVEIICIDGSVDEKELERLIPWSKDLLAERYSKRRKCAALYLVWGEGFALYIFIRRYNK